MSKVTDRILAEIEKHDNLPFIDSPSKIDADSIYLKSGQLEMRYLLLKDKIRDIIREEEEGLDAQALDDADCKACKSYHESNHIIAHASSGFIGDPRFL